MTDLEFLALFKISELPECSTGLWLLKQWVETDAAIPNLLRQPEHLNVEDLRRDGNPVFLKFLEHTSTCLDCSQLLPQLRKPLQSRPPLIFRSR